jgi:hypothetical protein
MGRNTPLSVRELDISERGAFQAFREVPLQSSARHKKEMQGEDRGVLSGAIQYSCRAPGQVTSREGSTSLSPVFRF